jgi:hypothetical protein
MPACEPERVDVDGTEVVALVRKAKPGDSLTDIDRRAIADFARFLRVNARARQHRTTEPKEPDNA